MLSLVEIGPVVLEKKMKFEKFTTTTTTTTTRTMIMTDNGQRIDQKSSLEPLAQVS